jgi:hypothetical protein
MPFDLYRPELHYMRGRGPKWHTRHDLESCVPGRHIPGHMLASSHSGMPRPSTITADAVRDANEAKRNDRAGNMMLQTFRNWPNVTFVAICIAGVLSVLFLLSIATSLIASSSSSVNAEPPENGCVAIARGEYQGAYRKKLLLTRFGTYERTGQLGRYSYWYCR